MQILNKGQIYFDDERKKLEKNSSRELLLHFLYREKFIYLLYCRQPGKLEHCFPEFHSLNFPSLPKFAIHPNVVYELTPN